MEEGGRAHDRHSDADQGEDGQVGGSPGTVQHPRLQPVYEQQVPYPALLLLYYASAHRARTLLVSSANFYPSDETPRSREIQEQSTETSDRVPTVKFTSVAHSPAIKRASASAQRQSLSVCQGKSRLWVRTLGVRLTG